MSKSENPRFVFFLFPHSKRVAAAFSLPRARCFPSSLCCLSRIRGRADAPLLFFLLSTRFATSLTFVFCSFSSASRIKREFSGPFRRRRPTLQLYILTLLLDASTVGTRAEDLSPSTGISKRVAAAFSLLRAGCLPSSLCCLSRIRGHAGAPLLFFLLSTRFATSLTFVFVLFPQLLASSASSPARAEPFRRRRPALQQHPRPAPRREHRRHSSGRSLSPWTVIQAAVLKQAFYDSKGTSPSTRPLPSSRRRRSAPSPTRTSSSLERRVLSERLPRNGVL